MNYYFTEKLFYRGVLRPILSENQHKRNEGWCLERKFIVHLFQNVPNANDFNNLRIINSFYIEI